jgi:hypothetical protein
MQSNSAIATTRGEGCPHDNAVARSARVLLCISYYIYTIYEYMRTQKFTAERTARRSGCFASGAHHLNSMDAESSSTSVAGTSAPTRDARHCTHLPQPTQQQHRIVLEKKALSTILGQGLCEFCWRWIILCAFSSLHVFFLHSRIFFSVHVDHVLRFSSNPRTGYRTLHLKGCVLTFRKGREACKAGPH